MKTSRALLLSLLLAVWPGSINATQPVAGFTDTFSVDKRELVSRGKNPFFALEPGVLHEFASSDTRLVVTVLADTLLVDGVQTRVVEERESKNGALVEVSRNYFAISSRTNSVFYFGEDVDMYAGGRIINHEGSWRSGVSGAHFGLMMPGLPLLRARYQQEVAPGVAMDRAEILSVTERCDTPRGPLAGCVRVEETTPLEPSSREYKVYAPGFGLVRDGELKLVR